MNTKLHYAFKAPEFVEVDTSHPLWGALDRWAFRNKISAKQFDYLARLLVSYEASLTPDVGLAQKEVGADRCAAVAQWGRANLTERGYQALRTSMTERNATVVFRVVEHLIRCIEELLEKGPVSR